MSTAYHLNVCSGPACLAVLSCFCSRMFTLLTLYSATFPTYQNIFRWHFYVFSSSSRRVFLNKVSNWWTPDILSLSSATHLPRYLFFYEQIPGGGQCFYIHQHAEEVLMVTLTRCSCEAGSGIFSIPGSPAGEQCPCLGMKEGMLGRKEAITMINNYFVGFKALKLSSAGPPTGVWGHHSSTSLSWGKKWKKPKCKHPEKFCIFFSWCWYNDFEGASVHRDLLCLFFLVLQRALHHYSRPWPYFHTAAELARKRHQGKLLLNFTLYSQSDFNIE